MKNINKNEGFTLVEVFITIIIIGILSVIGVSVYRKHIDNAKYNEGIRLLQSIKEQQDLALSFASDATGNPFDYIDAVVVTTYTFDRSAQNLGKFYIYPQSYKYFRSFTIREPLPDEKSKYQIDGHGYVIEAYYPDANNPQLTLKLFGSSEGPYTIVRE